MKMNDKERPVSIYEMPNGKKVIRVRSLDEDFLLDPNLIDNGKWYTFKEAMERLKEIGLTTYNKKEALLVSAYHDEIEKAIEVLNGDKLNWEWSVSSFTAYNAWSCYGIEGTVGSSYKRGKCTVRPIYVTLI